MVLLLTTGACDTETSPLDPPSQTSGSGDFRVYASPYREVQWSSVLRLRTQLHDHPGRDTLRIKANDRAGYHVLGLQQYSGVPSLSYTVRERIWPPDQVLPEGFRARLTNVRLFIPNAEEVGYDHLTSPFLETYIEKWELSGVQRPERRHYRSTQEAITLIRESGGMAFLAHPWGPASRYRSLAGFTGMEIYSAFAAVQRGGDLVDGNEDPNGVLLDLWDDLLSRDQRILGIAVNDHYGPDNGALRLDDPLRDSGKTVVFAADTSMAAFRTALEQGAFVAVRDFGVPKNQYPSIRSIRALNDRITIDTDGEVDWVSQGKLVASGPTLRVGRLRTGYVRAEVRGGNGSVVYTQAFSLRPIGDIDGDGDVDDRDRNGCASLGPDKGGTPEERDACRWLGEAPDR